MRENKTDRRSLRTRQMLTRALMDLMKTRRYDSISVQELAEAANVGRSTFYAHFTDKDDLLKDGVNRMLASLETEGTARAGRLFPTLALFRHIGGQPEMYQVMSRGRALTLFITALQDEIAKVLEPRLREHSAVGTTPAVPPSLLAVMYAGMLLAAIRSWIEGGLVETVEDIDRKFHAAADAAVRAGLRPT